jgi:diacylglycerol kinase (ATP)
MPAAVIFNPYADHWQARVRWPAVQSAFAAEGIAHRLYETTGPGQAGDFAQEAVRSGQTPIVAAGGDGLIGEVVNGLVRAGSRGPLGIMPLGTANDLADVLGIPRDLSLAARVIASGARRVIDLGVVNGRAFANNSGVGMEAAVTLTHIGLRRLHGVTRYVAAAMLTVMRRPAWAARLEWDAGAYEGSLTLVSVGNTRRTGGVFFMTPDAAPDDGLLDVVFAPALSRPRLLRLLPMTMKGTHVRRPEVRSLRTSALRIVIAPGAPVQADGEIVATAATEIVYTTRPGALEVLVPGA